MSAYEVIREEGMDPENPSYVCFRIDPMVIAAGGIVSRVKDRDGKIKFENYEIATYFLDMQCVECGALLTAPTPLDREITE